MPSSMTGYGQAEACGYHIEIKGLNHRFKEIRVKLPRDLSRAEMHARNAISDAIQRGKVDIVITRSTSELERLGLSINWDLAEAYHLDLSAMAQRFGGEVTFKDIMWIPGVMGENERELADPWPLLQEALEKAIKAFVESRLEEGNKLRHAILDRIDAIDGMYASIKELAKGIPGAYRERLKANLESLFKDTIALDEVRLAQEVAIMAEKCDITEELVRLQSHLDTFREVMHAEGAIGRRLDFMLQEINRELNTIGSKSPIASVSHLVIDAKTEIEKIREQVQNIE